MNRYPMGLVWSQVDDTNEALFAVILRDDGGEGPSIETVPITVGNIMHHGNAENNYVLRPLTAEGGEVLPPSNVTPIAPAPTSGERPELPPLPVPEKESPLASIPSRK